MLKLNHINLAQNPGLIQPPKVEDNIVHIRLVADHHDIIKADILDVALSYAIAGIDVILELPFADRDKFNHQQLASLICNGGWSLSLLPPEQYNSVSRLQYCKSIIEWYELWRSNTMRNFEKVIYPITPYLEYLTTHYLIDKNKKDLKSKDTQALIALSQNPSDPYLLKLMETMETDVVDAFKQQLKTFIQKQDKAFYQDIDLLIDQVAKAKAKCSI